MAGYRQFHTQFWKDEWVMDLDPLERYLYIYLFSNDLSSISGIYKIPKKVIANETGLTLDFINAAFEKFAAAQKIAYAEGVLWVVNMAKFHRNASPLTMRKVIADTDAIPDGVVKRGYQYYVQTGIYSIDTVSIPISLSVSKSVRESVSVSESSTAPAVANSRLPVAYKTILDITQWAAIPPGNDEYIDAMWSLWNRHGAKTVEYCKPFYDEYKRRYKGTTTLGWIDWAVTGTVPPAKRNQTMTPQEQTEARIKALQEIV